MKSLAEDLKETVARQQQEDAAGLEAAQEMFPGALKNIFALDPDVVVGPYRVRPCYDYDLRVLRLLNHPVYDMVILGKETDFVPTSDEGHVLAWMFTHTPREVKEASVKNLLQLANEAWEFVQPRVVMAVCNAAVDQIVLSLTGRLAYKNAENGGAEEAKANRPPS